MDSIIALLGPVVLNASVYLSYEVPILISRGIDIIKIILGG